MNLKTIYLSGRVERKIEEASIKLGISKNEFIRYCLFKCLEDLGLLCLNDQRDQNAKLVKKLVKEIRKEFLNRGDSNG